MRLSIHEVLQKVATASTPQERIALLRQNDNVVLRTVLKYNFDPAIKFNLPEGEPPFKTDRNLPMGVADTSLFQEARRLYIFVEGLAPANLRRTQRETLYINLLEGLHYTEADLVIALKDKALATRYPGLTVDLVMEALPGTLPADMPREAYTIITEAPKAVVVPDDVRKELAARGIDVDAEIQRAIPNAPTIVARGEEAPKEKKPTNPKKVAACLKASEARRRNAAARRAEKEAAAKAASENSENN